MYIPLITIGNNTKVIYHEVDELNTNVEVMCTGDLKLIRVTGNQGEVSSRNVSVSAPSNQEKFLCVDESNNVEEIQYISIKGDSRYTHTPYIHTCSHTHTCTRIHVHTQLYTYIIIAYIHLII